MVASTVALKVGALVACLVESKAACLVGMMAGCSADVTVEVKAASMVLSKVAL